MRHVTAASLALIASMLAAGCHGNSMTSAQFTPSMTAPAPGLVKIVPHAGSGARVVLDVVIFGPEPGLDLSGFAFGVSIGDPALVRFVPSMDYLQTALMPGAGQTVAIDVDGNSEPSVVRVDVTKQGGGAGNGIVGNSAIAIELAFEVQGAGATTLSLVGLGGNPPRAISSTGATIGAVNFDAASASIRGVTTGGGGY